MPDPTKPLKISDKKEFERRQQAYNDSLSLYNNFDSDVLGTIIQGPIRDLSDKEKQDLIDLSTELTTDKIAPIKVAESRGGTMQQYFYKKPTQPVEYVEPKREQFFSIPTKRAKLPMIEDMNTFLSPIQPVDAPTVHVPTKDARRFTAGDYLESQGLPSGYVNYGRGEGQQDRYENGGIRNINDNIGFLFNKKFGIQ